MFCSICQRSFKVDKTYAEHLKTRAHAEQARRFSADPSLHRRQMGDIFVSHFISFVSGIDDYTELDLAYRSYLSGNRYRIKGTNYKSIHDCAPLLAHRVDLKEEGGVHYVRKRQIGIKKRPVRLEEIVRIGGLLRKL
ncbi:hypothetical protein PAPHI01_0298 [Pancytospora philotis]|nr:hypothetical protein PAPHI01_0298 [Pancytospora philotis]